MSQIIIIRANGTSAAVTPSGAFTFNDSGVATIGAGYVSNTMLVNSSVTINGTAVTLGASGTVAAAAGTLTGTTLASNVATASISSTNGVGLSGVLGVMLLTAGSTQLQVDGVGALTINGAGLNNVGTLTSGATGAGFTIALTTSTITGNLPDARNTVSNSTTTTLAAAGLAFTRAATTGSPSSYLTITTPADTALTASTENIGINKTAATRQFATGAITTQREVVFAAPTYGFVGASTMTTAINVDIADPAAGTNATLTSKFGLRVANQLTTAAQTFTGGTKAAPSLRFPVYNWYDDGGGAGFTLTDTANTFVSLHYLGIKLKNNCAYSWQSNDSTLGTTDTQFSRKAAGNISADTTTIGDSLGTVRGTWIAAGTATSCTGATIGSGSKNNAGFITATTTGASTIVITFSVTATTGWSVMAFNGTTVANLITQTAGNTTTATLTGTTVSGDVIRYVAIPY